MWKFPLFSIFLWCITNVTAESDWLAIEFSVSNETISHSGSLFTCIKLRLRPEESNKDFEMQLRVQHHISLPRASKLHRRSVLRWVGIRTFKSASSVRQQCSKH